MTPFEAAKSQNALIDAAHKAACHALKAIAGDQKSPLGLTPDHVKNTPEWRSAYHNQARLFANLRASNADLLRRFPGELRAERAAKRVAK